MQHGGTTGLQTSGSPVKESSFLNRETSAEEVDEKENKVQIVSPQPAKEGIPIRR